MSTIKRQNIANAHLDAEKGEFLQLLMEMQIAKAHYGKQHGGSSASLSKGN
jgi:hypothetical protein